MYVSIHIYVSAAHLSKNADLLLLGGYKGKWVFVAKRWEEMRKVKVKYQTNLAPPTTFEVWRFGLALLRWGDMIKNQKLIGQMKLSGRALYDDGQMINRNVINTRVEFVFNKHGCRW